MDLRTYTPFILGIIVIMAVLGMPLMLASPIHHEMGCPFTGMQSICSMSSLEYVKHWQIAFASILVEILVIAALADAVFRRWQLIALPEPYHVRLRNYAHIPARPTLFQELYSRGVLNRKEP